MSAAKALRIATAIALLPLRAGAPGGAAAAQPPASRAVVEDVYDTIRRLEARATSDPGDGPTWRALGEAYERGYPGTGYPLWAWMRGSRLSPRDRQMRASIADAGIRVPRSLVFPVAPLSNREALFVASLGMLLAALSLGLTLLHGRRQARAAVGSIPPLPLSAGRQASFRRSSAPAPQPPARAPTAALRAKDGAALSSRVLLWTGVLLLTVGVVVVAELRASRNIGIALPARSAIRRSPVRGAPVLGAIRAGTFVRVAARREWWVRIATLDGVEGWVEEGVVGGLEDQAPLFPAAGFLAQDFSVSGAAAASALKSSSDGTARAPEGEGAGRQP